MKEQQARDIVARIERDYPGRILATLDAHQALPDGNGYLVALLLLTGQRRATIGRLHQVEDMLAAWQPFLGSEREREVQQP